jgi:hypothetical protein
LANPQKLLFRANPIALLNESVADGESSHARAGDNPEFVEDIPDVTGDRVLAQDQYPYAHCVGG